MRLRNRLVLHLYVSVLVIGMSTLAFNIQLAMAHSGNVLGPAWTTTAPTIDGTLGLGEWTMASTSGFTIAGTYIGTVYVMNDGTNLYIAVSISDPTPGNDQIGIFFDNNHNGIWPDLPAEDTIVYYSPPAVSTGFHDLHETPAGTNRDVNVGGTNDGSGATGTTATDNVYEFSHPLSSGDIYDFSLSFGQTVGFALKYFDNNVIQGTWPGPVSHPIGSTSTCASQWGDIVIASPPSPIPEFSFATPIVTSLATAIYLAIRKRKLRKTE